MKPLTINAPHQILSYQIKEDANGHSWHAFGKLYRNLNRFRCFWIFHLTVVYKVALCWSVDVLLTEYWNSVIVGCNLSVHIQYISIHVSKYLGLSNGVLHKSLPFICVAVYVFFQSLLCNVSVKTLQRQRTRSSSRRMVGRIVFYAVHIISNDSIQELLVQVWIYVTSVMRLLAW